MNTRTDRVADDEFRKRCCCVCGCEVVKEAYKFKSKDFAACGQMCHQLFVFLQGLICGHALCSLLKQCVDIDNYKGELIGITDPVTEVIDASDSKTDQLIKTENVDQDCRKNCGSYPEGSVLGELLQVTFDEDPDASQNFHEVDSNSSDANISSLLQPEHLTSNSLLAVPNTTSADVSNSVLQHMTADHFGSCIPCESSNLWAVQKEKIQLPAVQEYRHNSTHRTKSGVDIDISVRTDNNSAASYSKKKIPCDVCGELFVESHLHVHMKAKHSENLSEGENESLFSCNVCNRKFNRQAQLNKHVAKKHPGCKNLTKSCTICHKGFSNQIGLSVHMRHVHKALSPKQCDLCHSTFKSCKELSRHKLHDHKERAHVCHLCGKNFAYGHALKSHLDAHAGIKKHFCEICGEGFVRMTSLCGHRISAHTKKEEVVHKCEICETNHKTKALLNKHLFEIHFTGPYVVKDYKLQKHVPQDQDCLSCTNAEDGSNKCSLHSGNENKQFICSQCGKSFSKAHYLKAHEKQHQAAKFSCDICCKLFTYKCNLKAHQSTHSSDKPFQCAVCSKQFRLKFLLEDHQRTHNRDLLFKCYVCGRGFTRIPNLKRHIRAMHPEVSLKQNTMNTRDDQVH